MLLKKISDRSGLNYFLSLATDGDVSAIRKLVNLAYRDLDAAGLNFTGAHQDDQLTRERMSTGRTFVIRLSPQEPPIGTIHLSADYSATDTAMISQLGVHPDYTRRGLGSLLMNFAESFAHQDGYQEVRLSTAKPAQHLVRFYSNRGYRIVRETQFPGKVYESWILAKPLRAAVEMSAYV